MVEWDHKKSLRLLDEYEKARILWDPKHPYYYSKPKKQEIWETIANKFDIDMDELKKKMNSLLGSFRRERSKTRRGLAAGKEYNSRWFAYEKLKFLLDQRDDAEAIEDIEIEDALNFEMNFQDEEEIYEVMLEDTSATNRQTAVSNKRPKLECISSPQQFTYCEKLPSTTVTLVDEFDAIGKNVAAKLRFMKSTQRIVAEKLIHDALFYGQLEKLTDTSCVQLIQMSLHNSLTLISKPERESDS